MKPPAENGRAALLDEIAVANLAAIRSRTWSYGWRVGHLIAAVEPAHAANDLRLRREIHDPREFRYFSRKQKGQLLDTTAAAIVVLVHSFLDAAITELLATCIMQDESRWRDRIISEWRKEYTLGEALALDHETILEQATNHYLKRVGHKSIVARHELLLPVILPSGKIRDASMSKHLDTIKRVDDARHRVVHNNGLMGATNQTLIDDSGHLLAYAEELVEATAAMFGISESDIASQMFVLGLEGVYTPLLPEDLEGL